MDASIDTTLANGPFQPLNVEKREIWLVRLGPSRLENNAVLCRLEIVRLTSRPTFEALSWCWDDPTQTKEIILTGEKSNAPASLVDALRSLRHVDQQRKLWVYTLSINQAAEDEALCKKAQLIQLMKYIYSIAMTVIMWVGRLPEDFSTFLLCSLVDGQTLEAKLCYDTADTIGYMISILLLSW